MTRNRHDLFAKQHLEALLETVGDVTSSRKIVSETREVDILFVPHQKVHENLTALGVLGRIAAHICLIEPFRNSVQVDEVISCIGKLINFTEELRRQAKRERQVLKSAEYPRLWILSPTVSAKCCNISWLFSELDGQQVFIFYPSRFTPRWLQFISFR